MGGATRRQRRGRMRCADAARRGRMRASALPQEGDSVRLSDCAPVVCPRGSASARGRASPIRHRMGRVRGGHREGIFVFNGSIRHIHYGIFIISIS
jgi:hypothetical protein